VGGSDFRAVERGEGMEKVRRDEEISGGETKGRGVI
jgi:hypothetical protein